MQIATTPVTKAPILTTSGPADWQGVPLATIEYASPQKNNPHAGSRAVFAGDVEYIRGARTLDDVIISATRMSWSHDRSSPSTSVAVGVLQSEDGAWYITKLNETRDRTHATYFPENNLVSRFAIFATPRVDALRAIVGGDSIVRFPLATKGAPGAPVGVADASRALVA